MRAYVTCGDDDARAFAAPAAARPRARRALFVNRREALLITGEADRGGGRRAARRGRRDRRRHARPRRRRGARRTASSCACPASRWRRWTPPAPATSCAPRSRGRTWRAPTPRLPCAGRTCTGPVGRRADRRRRCRHAGAPVRGGSERGLPPLGAKERTDMTRRSLASRVGDGARRGLRHARRGLGRQRREGRGGKENAAKVDVAKAGDVTLTVWDQEVRGGQAAQIKRSIRRSRRSTRT